MGCLRKNGAALFISFTFHSSLFTIHSSLTKPLVQLEKRWQEDE